MSSAAKCTIDNGLARSWGQKIQDFVGEDGYVVGTAHRPAATVVPASDLFWERRFSSSSAAE